MESTPLQCDSRWSPDLVGKEELERYASLYLLQIDAFAALASSVHLADCRLIVAEC